MSAPVCVPVEWRTIRKPSGEAVLHLLRTKGEGGAILAHVCLYTDGQGWGIRLGDQPPGRPAYDCVATAVAELGRRLGVELEVPGT